MCEWATTQLLRWVSRCTWGREGPLEADQHVPHQAGEDELSPHIRMNASQAAANGQPEVEEDRLDGNEHADAAGDGHDLQPRGRRGLEEVVGADVGVEHEDRPESDQGQGMAEEGGPADDGNDIVGHAHGERREEEPHDAVPVEPGQDGIGHAGDGAGGRVPHGVAEEIDERGENQGGKGIPHRDVEELLLPEKNGPEKVIEDHRQGQEYQDVRRPNPLRILPALGIPQGEGDTAGGHSQIVNPQSCPPQPLAVQGGPYQGGDEIVNSSQEGSPYEPKDHQVGVDGPDSPEDEPGDPLQEIGGHQGNGPDKARQSRHNEPGGRGNEKAADRSICARVRWLQGKPLMNP
jgi:hypothetical protein